MISLAEICQALKLHKLKLIDISDVLLDWFHAWSNEYWSEEVAFHRLQVDCTDHIHDSLTNNTKSKYI